MCTQQLPDQILPILHWAKDDKEKLQRILDFLMDEIYEEPDKTVEIPEKYREVVHDKSYLWGLNTKTVNQWQKTTRAK